jgi:uncharacterized protein YndB with AHSA1/START domain
MSITEITKDTEQLTMTVTADYDADAGRVWQLWSDPRRLERWWGPPTWPATVQEHDLTPGGRVRYFMTGPGGETAHGFWQVVDVEPPHRLVLDDGFADASGAPAEDLPLMRMTVDISDRPGGTTMTISTRFDSLEAMQQVVEMGMEEGLREAMGQIDAILAEVS